MMKKILATIVPMLFFVSFATADMKIGISGTGALFEDAKGTEENQGQVADETAELGAVYGTIFIEAKVFDMFSIGIDYMPMAIEGETVTNARSSDGGNADVGTNNASVDIEDHTTLYAIVPLGSDGVYAKLGASYADVVVNENNFRNTTYSDEELYGGHISLGYERDFSGTFIRGEAGYSEYATVESQSSSGDTRVKASLGGGIHARISVGKSF
tara:strand:+ start:619 stop:1260 length:642 start_codon:yes stop_codon:yes gene_type:complete